MYFRRRVYLSNYYFLTWQLRSVGVAVSAGNMIIRF